MKTDSQLQQDVIAELAWEPAVQATQIGVEVKHGFVTLAGEVSSYAEKLNAEHAAQRVAGVKGLAVEIKVKLPGFGQRSDVDITESAKKILDWTSSLPADSVKVMVEGGWLTLTGNTSVRMRKTACATSQASKASATKLPSSHRCRPRW